MGVDELASAILVSERTVVLDGVPGVVGEFSGKRQLLRRVEFLPWNGNAGYGYKRRQSLGPLDGGIFDRHSSRISLRLKQEVELHFPVRKRHCHGLSQPIGWRPQRDSGFVIRSWPDGILDSLAFPAEIGNAAPILDLEGASVHTCVKPLHRHVEEVGIKRVQEVEDRGSGKDLFL